ncbi:hypothetical protein ABEG17_02630 [Pedococcus sp. KACC 23699]|uniref:Uncharacterized protein n=1 Tax=Pedococcus sp. KACC 23699 TaxID=3149228 RepID=A0AAU7JVM0_9MICO
MNPDLIRLAYNLIDTEVATQYAFTNDPHDPRESLLRRRQELRDDVTGLVPEDLWCLAEALTDLACSSLHNLVSSGEATYGALDRGLRQALDTRNLHGFANPPCSLPETVSQRLGRDDRPTTCRDARGMEC